MPAAGDLTLAILAGLAAGILGADRAPELSALAPALGVGAAIVVVATIAVPARRGWLLVIAVAAASVALGALRGTAADPLDAPNPVSARADGREWRIEGTVVDDPRPRGDRQQIVLDELLLTGAEDATPRGRILAWLPRGPRVAAGDRVRLDGRLETPRDFDGFAYREYLARQGIGALVRTAGVEVIGRRGGAGVAMANLRRVLLAGLNRVVPEPEAALGAGILLGVRSAIDPAIDDAFATAGLTHVVAISGWNIAIVAAVVTALLRPLAGRRGGRWLTIGLSVASVGGYVLLAGASPSVVRAALMAGAMLVARLGGSRAHAGSALALAATIMLVAAPPVLWDVGFQLSLLATAGLIWFGPSVEARLDAWPGWLREPVALTLAAQLTTLPVIVANFERLSLVAPLANVIVVPIVPFAMLASAVAAVVGVIDGAVHPPLLGDALAWLAGGATWLSLRAMIAAGTVCAGLPMASVSATVPLAVAAAWYPLLGLAGWALRSPEDATRPGREVALRAMRPVNGGAITGTLGRLVRRAARPRWAALALVAVLAAVSIGARPDGRLHLTVLDVGQGDAVLVEAPSGATLLIDGGPDPERTLRSLGAQLPFFVHGIDVLLLTHPHQDHVAGFVEILARYRVRLVLHAGIGFENAAYDRFLADAAGEPGGQLALARAGQRIALDASTSLEILYPTAADAAAPLPEGDINNGSIVALLTYGDFSALLTGDAEAPIEATLLGRGLVPPVDVLKVGHHGSDSSTTPALLDAAQPHVAIISCGVENTYGHPAPVTLETLGAWPGLATYRTDQDGSVEVITDGRSYEVRSAGEHADGSRSAS